MTTTPLILRLLDGAIHRERFLRIQTASGTKTFPAEAIGESSEGACACQNGIVVELLAPHVYNVLVTTIDDGRIEMMLHAAVDEHGKTHGRYEYNAFGLGFRTSSEQGTLDEYFKSIDAWIANEPVRYWDLVNRKPDVQ